MKYNKYDFVDVPCQTGASTPKTLHLFLREPQPGGAGTKEVDVHGRAPGAVSPQPSAFSNQPSAISPQLSYEAVEHASDFGDLLVESSMRIGLKVS